MDYFTGHSPIEGRKFKQWLHKERIKDERRRHKETLQKLRDTEKTLRAERQTRLGAARTTCTAQRQVTRAAADKAYKRAVERAREARRVKKRAAIEACKKAREAIRSEVSPAIAHARQARQEEARAWKQTRRREQDQQKRERPRSSAAERRGESDHEVVVNIPEHMIPLWELVRRKIKGSDRMTRTEAFLHYVEEHPDEVILAQEREAERFLKAEQRKMAEEAKKSRGVHKARPGTTKAIDNYNDLLGFFDSVALTG